jgi:hypothetical protein
MSSRNVGSRCSDNFKVVHGNETNNIAEKALKSTKGAILNIESANTDDGITNVASKDSTVGRFDRSACGCVDDDVKKYSNDNGHPKE